MTKTRTVSSQEEVKHIMHIAYCIVNYLEFKSVSRRLSSGQVEAVFKSYDKNKDDKLSYDEFQSFMLHSSS